MRTRVAAGRLSGLPRWRLASTMVYAGLALFVLGFALSFLLESDAGQRTAGILLVAGGALGVTGLNVLGSFERLALVRQLQDLPTSRIASAPQGYVELRGTVCEAPRLIACGVCGLPCLWFVAPPNATVKASTREAPNIVLDDGTGRCLIRPAGAELLLAVSSQGHGHICPGDELIALGELRSRTAATPDGDGLLQDAGSLRHRRMLLSRKLEALKKDHSRMAVYDVNRDGQVDMREWDAARRVAEAQVAREATQAPPTDVPSLVLARPSSERDRLPFLLFVGSEKQAIRTARRDIALRMLMGFAVGAILINLALRTDFRIGPHPKHRAAKTAPATAPAPAPAPPERTARQQAFDLHRQSRLDEAVAAYDSLLVDNPYDAEVAYWRATALGRLGRQAEAVAGVIRACDLGFQRACDFMAQNPDDFGR